LTAGAAAGELSLVDELPESDAELEGVPFESFEDLDSVLESPLESPADLGLALP